MRASQGVGWGWGGICAIIDIRKAFVDGRSGDSSTRKAPKRIPVEVSMKFGRPGTSTAELAGCPPSWVTSDSKVIIKFC